MTVCSRLWHLLSQAVRRHQRAEEVVNLNEISQTILVISGVAGGVLGGLGLFITRVARALPEVRETVDWLDDRRDRRQRDTSTISPSNGAITKRSA